jgi:hypothetical protein
MMNRLLIDWRATTFALILTIAVPAFSQINISGLADKGVYSDRVTFTVTAEAGFTYDARLDSHPIAVGTPVLVNQVDYHELSASRTNTTTLEVTNQLIRFIVDSSERGSTEDGLPPWTPYPPILSATNEFSEATLRILAPQNFPQGMPIPIVAWVENVANHVVRVNGTVAAPGQVAFKLLRGVGSGFLAGTNVVGALNYQPTIGGLTTNKIINIESDTVWTGVSGTLSGNIDWPPDSRIAITNHVVLASGSTLTIGAGSIVRVSPGVDITNNASIVINGTWERPVVFAPVSPNQPWGGFTMRTSEGGVTGIGVIFTGSGAIPNWFGTGGNPGSHRTEQSLFFCGGNNVVSLTDSAAISLAGQLGHAVAGGTFTFNRFLMQRTTTGGEFTGASFRVNDSAFIECPDDSADFVDGDNDSLYLWSGTHGFTNTLIGFTKDDGVDSGGDGSGLLNFQDCWFESTFHEGNSLSGTGKIVNHYHSVFLNCGQGLEAGYNGPTGNMVGCLATGNLVGGRFGDNYNWTYDGFLRATDSLLIYNYRNVWGMTWSDWGYRTAQMDIRSNLLSVADAIWPANEVWNPNIDATQLARFFNGPADGPVGIGFALRTNRVTIAVLTNGIPVRLSRFSTNVVSANYIVESPSGVLASGTLVFLPGETVKQLSLTISNPESYDLLSVSLSHPTQADITGLAQVFALGTNAVVSSSTLVPFGSTWHYLDNGIDQGPDWIPASFDDDAWSSGAGKFGFNSGNSGFATLLDFGPDSGNKYRTYYFRKQFTVVSPAAFTSLDLEVLRDDGIAVYLNGQDFYRNNLPNGTIMYSDLATNATDNGGTIQSATLPLTGLVTGTNLLAAEVHQSSAGSSDLVFDLQLLANPAPAAARLMQARLGNQLVLYWDDASYGLEAAPELSGPWTPMPPYNPQVVSMGTEHGFFRLRK